MNCEKILNKVYDGSEHNFHNSIRLLTRIRIGLHLIVCSDCIRKIERYEICKDILKNDFLPPSQSMEDTVMSLILSEEEKIIVEEEAAVTGGIPIRGWVIACLVMLVSLASIFLGFDFNKLVLNAGTSFMIPIGITVGIALTCYGALFIGSHLKELSRRFGL